MFLHDTLAHGKRSYVEWSEYVLTVLNFKRCAGFASCAAYDLQLRCIAGLNAFPLADRIVCILLACLIKYSRTAPRGRTVC